MKLTELKPAKGSKVKRTRVGRGHGSGMGKTSGKGMNGQKSRTGASIRAGFEGGQMPLYRRMPKNKGFKSLNPIEKAVVNVSTLNQFAAGSSVALADLAAKGIVAKSADQLRILGEGDLKVKIKAVKANYFTAQAKAKLEAAGVTCEVIA